MTTEPNPQQRIEFVGEQAAPVKAAKPAKTGVVRAAPAKPDLPPICGDCRFLAQAGGMLECRRLPPIGAQPRYNAAATPIWPPVRLGDWCGEHQPAEA